MKVMCWILNKETIKYCIRAKTAKKNCPKGQVPQLMRQAVRKQCIANGGSLLL
jgi:hypothetical protein